MVEFYGETSEECKQDAAKRRNKNTIIVFATGFVIIGIIQTTIFGILGYSEFWEFLIWTIALAVVFSLCVIPISKKRLSGFKVITKITVENGTVTYQWLEQKL